MSSTLSTHSVKILSTLIIVIDIMMLLAAIIFISNTKDANTQLTIGIISGISFILILVIPFILILLAEIRDNTKMDDEYEQSNDFSYTMPGDYENWKKCNPNGTINEYYASLRNNN